MTRYRANPRSTDARKRPAFRPRADALEGRLLLTAGDLDLTFGSGGYVLTSPRVESQSAGYSNDQAFGGVEVQTDGKILVVGQSSKTSTTSDWGVVRLTPSGSLDPTFGSGGRVLTTFPVAESRNQPHGTALQPDGKLVVVGTVVGSQTKVRGTTITDLDFCVVRYQPGGALDPSFGPNGSGEVITKVSTYQANPFDFAQAIALQADGKIIVGGYARLSDTATQAAMVRYNGDGTLDPTFGVGGKVVATLNNASDWVKDLEVLPDGKILALGSTFLARYNANGSLDTSFGSGGTGVTVPNLGATGTLKLLSMVVQADGGVVAGGSVNVGTNQNLALVRFTPAGVLDTSFAGTGAFVRDLGGDDMFSAKGLRIQADGKILAAGLSYNTPNKSVAARFLPNGTLDTSFATAGLVVRTFGVGGSTFDGSALQPDGKFVAVGAATSPDNNGTDADFLIARFLGDPAPLQAPSAVSQRTTTPILRSSWPQGTLLASVSAPAASPRGPETLSLIPLMPSTDQDLTTLATDRLLAGRKRYRPSVVN